MKSPYYLANSMNFFSVVIPALRHARSWLRARPGVHGGGPRHGSGDCATTAWHRVSSGMPKLPPAARTHYRKKVHTICQIVWRLHTIWQIVWKHQTVWQIVYSLPNKMKCLPKRKVFGKQKNSLAYNIQTKFCLPIKNTICQTKDILSNRKSVWQKEKCLPNRKSVWQKEKCLSNRKKCLAKRKVFGKKKSVCQTEKLFLQSLCQTEKCLPNRKVFAKLRTVCKVYGRTERSLCQTKRLLRRPWGRRAVACQLRLRLPRRQPPG